MDTIITLTMNPTIDLGLEIEKLEPERKLRSRTVRREPGGGGINVARGIRKLGGEACALFVGDKAIGGQVEDLLGAEGVPCRRLTVEGATREAFSVRVKDSDDLYHFVLPGPELRKEEIAQVMDAIVSNNRAPKYVVASGSLPPGVDDEFYGRLGSKLRDHGTRLVLDSHGAPLRAALEAGVYLVKPNLREFGELTGETPQDETAAREQSREVVNRYRLEVLVLTLDAEGALLTTANEQLRVYPPETRTVSPVGAGDSFLAACVFELARDATLAEALKSGVAAAAAAVRTPGTELFEVDEYRRIREQTGERPALANHQ